MDDRQFAEIAAKLDTTIRLLAAILVVDIKSQKDQILKLSSIGLRPTEIATLLGTKENNVNVTLSRERKKKQE